MSYIVRVLSRLMRGSCHGADLASAGRPAKRATGRKAAPCHPRHLKSVAATGGASQPLGTAERKARLTKGWLSDRTRRDLRTRAEETYDFDRP